MWVRYQNNGIFTTPNQIIKETGVVLILCADRNNLLKTRVEVSEANPDLQYKRYDDTFTGEDCTIKLFLASEYIAGRYYLAGQYKTIYVNTDVEIALGRVFVRLR